MTSTNKSTFFPNPTKIRLSPLFPFYILYIYLFFIFILCIYLFFNSISLSPLFSFCILCIYLFSNSINYILCIFYLFSNSINIVVVYKGASHSLLWMKKSLSMSPLFLVFFHFFFFLHFFFP